MTRWLIVFCFVFAVTGTAQTAMAATGSGLLQARQGVSALLRGQYERAILSYTDALEDKNLSDPRRANIYNDRGVAKWRLGRAKDAVEDFNRAIELFPDYSVVYNNRGNALIQLGRPDEAIADFNRAIAIAPGYGAAFNNRGNAHHALGRHIEAERDFRKAATLMPRNAVPFNGMGKAHVAQNRPFAAVRSYNRAIMLNAKYYSAHANRAAALTKLEQHDQSIPDYTQMVTQRPDDPNGYLLRGRAYANARKYNAAYRDFDKAAKLAPEMAEPHLRRAELHMNLKRHARAVTELTKAIANDPDLVQAYVQRARAQLNLKKPMAAFDDAIQALQLKPSDPDAMLVRGLVYLRLDQETNILAARDFQAVLKADPGNAEARTQLAALGYELPPEDPATQPKRLGKPVRGWVVTRTPEGRFFATNRRYPKVRVPLEMYGEGEPRVIAWNILKNELRGIGLLEYYAGDRAQEKKDAKQPLEYVAIVDLWRNQVVAVEPDRWGKSKAKWDWKRVSVVVTDPVGNANEVVLRRARGGDPYASYDESDPWFSSGRWHERARQQRPRPQRKRRQQRGLFDWLFNN